MTREKPTFYEIDFRGIFNGERVICVSRLSGETVAINALPAQSVIYCRDSGTPYSPSAWRFWVEKNFLSTAL